MKVFIIFIVSLVTSVVKGQSICTFMLHQLDSSIKNQSEVIQVIAENSQIIGLGESTHGSHELSQVRFELFKTMVTKHGYRLFILEAAYVKCLAIDKYVNTGVGSARSLLWELDTWPFVTLEMLEIIEWIKAYNQSDSVTEKVHFYGMDLIGESYDQLLYNSRYTLIPNSTIVSLNKLGKAAQQGTKSWRKLLKTYDTMLPQLLAQCDNSYDSLIMNNFLESTKFEILMYTKFKKARNFRELVMSRNISRIMLMHHGNAKAVVWAHNGHLQKDLQLPLTLGNYIAEEFEYNVIGTDFIEGSVLAISEDLPSHDFDTFYVTPCFLGNGFSFDTCVADSAYFILNTHRKIRVHHIGAGYSNHSAIRKKYFYTEDVILGKQFDIIILTNLSSSILSLYYIISK